MSIERDLGTYYLRVEFTDGRGYISRWGTGARYTGGTPEVSPLEAGRIGCTWSDESDLFSTMKFQYLENNWSCDCNRLLDLARAYHQEEPEDTGSCKGTSIFLKRLTAIRPDGSECLLWEGDEEKDNSY